MYTLSKYTCIPYNIYLYIFAKYHLPFQEKIEDYEQPLQISFEAKVNYDDPGENSLRVTV